MSLVTINDLILPRELSEFEEVLAPRLLKEAEMIVRAEFGRVHKNFPTETDEWEIFTVKRVIKEMVTSAILVGASPWNAVSVFYNRTAG